jgi:hypothetical protein
MALDEKDNLGSRPSFTARILDESALRELLAGEGLEFVRWLDRPGWFVARSTR